MENVLLVKLAGEIALKSNSVRKIFTERLLNNMRVALQKNNVTVSRIEKFPGRFFIYCEKLQELKKAQKILQKVFGIHSLALAEAHSSKRISLQELQENAFSYSKDFLKNVKTFAVNCTRVGKHDFSSHDVNVQVGAFLLKKIPSLKVDLSSPEKTLFIEIRDKKYYFFSEELFCYNGLPSGVEGNVGVFFEGKKADLIACWLMLKRGCNVFPIVKKNKMDKVLKKLKGKKESRKILSALKKLSEWNSFKEFKIISEENLKKEINNKRLTALVSSDEKVFPKEFQEFDAMQELSVLRPLVFLPKTYLKRISKLIEHA